MGNLHISIKAEPLFAIWGFTITNSVLATYFITIFILLLVFLYQIKFKPVYYLLHGLISGLYGFAESITGPKNAEKFFGFFATFFLFIIFSNWSGLIPGLNGIYWIHGEEWTHLFRAPTADLNTTIALALISIVAVQYYGLKNLGLGKQLSKYFDFSGGIQFFVGILELISEFSKILSFSFRLFGNIFAGEVLLLVIGFLVPLVATTPFLVLEIFVGFIQAFVFSMLTLVFMNLAVEHH